MSDIITCKAVLVKEIDHHRPDLLYIATSDKHLRILHCRPSGSPLRGEHPEWEYEERGGKLFVHPSLLCPMSGFHTAYNWECDYELGDYYADGYRRFFQLNPRTENQ